MSNTQHKSFGAVTVEFAIVVLFLVMLVFGITELGRALFQLNTLTKATETGARYLARLYGAVDFDETNGQCTEGAAWTETNLDIARNLVLYGTETEGTETLIPNMSVTDMRVAQDPRNAVPNSDKACVIVVETEAQYTSIFGDAGILIPFSSIDANVLDMQQKVEERYIGE